MSLQVKQIYEFGPFRIDKEERTLSRDGSPAPLTPKAFDVLLLLVERCGHILGKDELLNQVWADSFVEEGNLKVTVSMLRKVLEDGSGERQYIETIPRRGYRFVAEVRKLPDDEPAFLLIERSRAEVTIEEEVASSNQIPGDPLSPTRAASSRHFIRVIIALSVLSLTIAAIAYFPRGDRQIDSVAILPFVNVGADPNMEFLSDGLTESLINDLSQSLNLKVIARSSVFIYKDREVEPQVVARELKVQAVLVGRVRQRGDDLFISVELVDARDNSRVWGAQYSRKLPDVFAVQDEIARDISQRLRLKLTGEEKPQVARRYTENIKAFSYYTEGRAYIHRRTRKDLLKAASLYESAIKEDQHYALAYAGLAQAYAWLGGRGYIPPSEGRRKLEEAAQKAVTLDQNLAEAHVAMGDAYSFFAPYNFPLGDREFQHAIKLSPSLAVAHQAFSLSLWRQGRLDEGLVEMLKDRELDPLSTIIARQVALYHHLKREDIQSLQVLREVNEQGSAFVTVFEPGIYIQNRSYEEALTELEKAKQERRDDSVLICSRGMIYAAQGRRSDALGIIKELERLSGTDLSLAHWIAKIYATLSEKDLAFRWLDNGLGTGTIGAFFKDEPVWDALRADPRFTDLLRRMNVPH